MANGNLTCPLGGEPLTAVPGACSCGRFWMSMADVEAERQPSLPARAATPEAGPPREGAVPSDPASAAAPPARDSCPGCGGPPPLGAACEFCGWRPPEADSSATSPVCLVVAGLSLELPRGVPVSLGRDSGFHQVSALLAGFPGISREHVEVLVEGPHVRLRDMGSRNGTYIDGRELGTVAVRRPLPLRFRLGMSVEAEIRAVSDGEELRRWTGARG